MRKKALVILSRYLWPVDGGRKESLNHYLKELYDNYNYEITVLCFLEASQKILDEEKQYYIKEIRALQEVPTGEKIRNILVKSFGTSRWPFQCSMYFSKKNEQLIREYVNNLEPDLIFTEMIRTCTYYSSFSNSKAIKIANLDDLLSVRYERQLNSTVSNASFAGAYSEKLPSWLRKIISGNMIKKQVLKAESKRCEIWEEKFYDLYDFSLMTSNVERDILNGKMNAAKAKTLTVGVDCDYYNQPIASEKDTSGLAYVGNFSVASNIDTLEMMATKILPMVKSNYTLYIIGKCPEQIQKKYESNKQIVFCGRVDDLREYVKRATIFFSPIAYGTGVKTKIVEAMAMGMPVVTNSVGIEGIHAQAGRDIFVSDDYSDLANEVDYLLNNKEACRVMGENASKFAEDTFRWEKVFEVYKEIGL